MTALVSAELLRLRTVAAPRWIALGLLVLMVLMTVAPLLDAAGGAGATGSQTTELLRSVALTGALLAATFAAARAGGDFKQGATALTYLAEPRRGRVTAARALTYAGAGGLFAGAAAAVICAAGLALAGGHGLSPEAVGGIVAGAALGGLVLSAAGVLVGVAARNPTVASVAIVAWNVAEGLLGLAGVATYLPFALVKALMGAPGSVDANLAVALLAGYLALGALAVRRWSLPRDLT